MDEQWRETVGKEHLRSFFSLLHTAVLVAKENGIDKKTIDVDALMRLYRGDAPKLTDEQVKRARELHQNGISIAGLARRFGVSESTMYHIVKRKVRKDVD